MGPKTLKIRSWLSPLENPLTPMVAAAIPTVTIGTVRRDVTEGRMRVTMSTAVLSVGGGTTKDINAGIEIINVHP